MVRIGRDGLVEVVKILVVREVTVADTLIVVVELMAEF